jgi:metal-dependent amidase/aminoacylase/carboxypeptidase family protein
VSEKNVTAKEGRFGIYVTDGETNASLGKGDRVEDRSQEEGRHRSGRQARRRDHRPQRLTRTFGVRHRMSDIRCQTPVVIPETAIIEGTIRAVSESTRKKVHDGVRRVANGIAAAHNCEVEAEIHYGYPVTTTDDQFAEFSLALAREVAGAKATVQLPHPVMGAEDFSYLLNEVPGAMVFLGATPHGTDLSKVAPNHSNRVHFEESSMTTGIALYAATALRHLNPN